MRVPAHLQRLVADAAIFPPGDLPLPEAVAAHHVHQASEHADLVDGFVVDDRRLGDLVGLVARDDRPRLGLHVVVSGGAGAVAPALAWAAEAGSVRTVEVAVRDLDDPAGNVRRIVTAADLPDGAELYVELPRCPDGPSPSWLAAADEVAMGGFGVKLRTGGLTPDTFPTAAELVACLDAALDRELTFRCTAGLHHALPNHEDGLPHLGFLGVLLATRTLLDGGDAEAALTADRDEVLHGLAEAGEESLTRARRWFTGFGSCSITDPVTDLTDLGLLEDL